jgi:hypothetical protein
MSKKYKVDRQLLVNRIRGNTFNRELIVQNMLDAVVIGGEGIIMAEELLKIQGTMVPASIIINHDPLVDPALVAIEDCEIVYVQR